MSMTCPGMCASSFRIASRPDDTCVRAIVRMILSLGLLKVASRSSSLLLC